jgi:hypothetical protein
MTVRKRTKLERLLTEVELELMNVIWRIRRIMPYFGLSARYGQVRFGRRYLGPTLILGSDVDLKILD